MRLFGLVFLLVWGCGGAGSEQGSCNSVVGSDHQCVDYQDVTGGQLGSYKESCSATTDHWSSALCDHTGSSGGCQQQQTNGLVTIWYFNQTTDEVMADCQADGSPAFDYVAP